MSGRRSSAPGSATQQHYASFKMSGALYRIARKLPPNPKVVKKPKGRAGGGWNVKVSDEDVIGLIIRHMRGVPATILATDAGVSLDVLNHWLDGTNRGELLMEAEKRYAKIVASGP